MDIQQRKNLALEFHSKGYNCAQSVLLAFSDITGLDQDIAARMAMGFGAGLGGQGSVCGVVLGMSIAYNLTREADPGIKTKAYAAVRTLSSRFRDRCNGRWLCPELKTGNDRRPCDDLIADGVEILDQFLHEDQ